MDRNTEVPFFWLTVYCRCVFTVHVNVFIQLLCRTLFVSVKWWWWWWWKLYDRRSSKPHPDPNLNPLKIKGDWLTSFTWKMAVETCVLGCVRACILVWRVIFAVIQQLAVLKISWDCRDFIIIFFCTFLVFSVFAGRDVVDYLSCLHALIVSEIQSLKSHWYIQRLLMTRSPSLCVVCLMLLWRTVMMMLVMVVVVVSWWRNG